jgi:ZIP family zinc transporter
MDRLLPLAVGAGAILQVIVEVSSYLIRSNEGAKSTWLTQSALGGLLSGLAFMYATAAIIKI